MKKRISTNIRWARFLFIVLSTILTIALSVTLSNDLIDQEAVLVLTIFLIICPILYYLFDKAKTVEFDKEFMYITDKKEIVKVPLRRVFKIQLTMTQINKRNMWKISYYDKNNSQKSVRILPKLFYKDFYEFKDLVQQINKDLEFKNSSHSFDFDQ